MRFSCECLCSLGSPSRLSAQISLANSSAPLRAFLNRAVPRLSPTPPGHPGRSVAVTIATGLHPNAHERATRAVRSRRASFPGPPLRLQAPSPSSSRDSLPRVTLRSRPRHTLPLAAALPGAFRPDAAGRPPAGRISAAAPCNSTLTLAVPSRPPSAELHPETAPTSMLRPLPPLPPEIGPARPRCGRRRTGAARRGRERLARPAGPRLHALPEPGWSSTSPGALRLRAARPRALCARAPGPALPPVGTSRPARAPTPSATRGPPLQPSQVPSGAFSRCSLAACTSPPTAPHLSTFPTHPSVLSPSN